MKRLMNTVLTGTFLLMLTQGGISQDQPVCLDQTHAKWMDSKIIGDKFLIQCYIPEEKNVLPDSLPIIFVLDADMSFGLTYDVVRWLRWGQEIPPVAIVGISYGLGLSDWWDKRSRDYTPSKDIPKIWGDWPLAGGAKNFEQFLELELFKFIKDEFNLKGNKKTIIGLSLGGLLCADILLSKPGLFDNYIILGPALVWNDKEIFTKETEYFKINKLLSAHVFTAIGNLDEKDVKEPWAAFVEKLESRHYNGLTLNTWVIENETQLSMLPAGLTRGLKTVLNK